MISPSCLLKITFCSALTIAMPLGTTAADYGVDTTSSGNKLWSLATTWTGGGGVPNGADDTVTFGINPHGPAGLNADLEEITLAEFNVVGNSSNTRGIYGNDGVASTLKIGSLSHTGVGSSLAFRHGSDTARLSFEIGHLTLASGAIIEIGNVYEADRTRYSVESFVVEQSSTIAGILRFNNIRNRAPGENILNLGALNLSGEIVLGGRGNTGGVLKVSSLTGAVSANIHLYNSSIHNGTSGTLEIDSTPSNVAVYEGQIREHRNSTMAGLELDVVKKGEGTQIFARQAGQIYTGGTSIEEGVLAITNTSGSGLGLGKVTVSESGILAGGGRLELSGAAVEIKAGGTLAPSAHLETGVATLTISGAQTPTGPLLSLEEGATLSFRLEAGGNSDHIAFTGWHEGGLDLASQGVTIDVSGILEGRFDLFSFDAIDTSELSALVTAFNAQTLGSGFAGWQGVFGYDTQDGNMIWLEVSAIPEPGNAALVLIGLGAIGWQMRKRTNE